MKRDTWTRISERCEEAPYQRLWLAIFAAVDKTPFQWFRVHDRVADDTWRVFSPEVSGNKL